MVKLNSMITCKSLETGKLFGNAIMSVKFHSCLLRLLEFRPVIHWTPLFLEIWVPALHLLLPSLTPPATWEPEKTVPSQELHLSQCCLHPKVFICELLDLPCPCAQHSALGKTPWSAGNDTKSPQTSCIKPKMWPFSVFAAFPVELALPVLSFT